MNRLIKIAIVGAECSGKSTLSRALSFLLNAEFCYEYARIWVIKSGRAVAFEDVLSLYQGQKKQMAQSEKKAVESEKCAVVWDTELLQSRVYSEFYFGKVPKEITIEDLMLADIYFLMDYQIPWESETMQRGEEVSRKLIHEALVKALKQKGVPYFPLSGTLEERLKQAEAHLKPLLSY